MSSQIPNSVKYKWTILDKRATEQPQTNSGPLLTPYKIWIGAWPEAKTFDPGMMVDVPISLSWEKAALSVYYQETLRYSWEDTPENYRNYSTLGELCTALTTNLPNSYESDHFNLRHKDALTRTICMKRLFEYWGNTLYRYAVIESTGKDPYIGNTWEQTPASVGKTHIKTLYTIRAAVSTVPAAVNRPMQNINHRLRPTLADKVAHLKSLHDGIIAFQAQIAPELEERAQMCMILNILQKIALLGLEGTNANPHIGELIPKTAFLSARIKKEFSNTPLNPPAIVLQNNIFIYKQAIFNLLFEDTALSEAIRSYIKKAQTENLFRTEKFSKEAEGLIILMSRCLELISDMWLDDTIDTRSRAILERLPAIDAPHLLNAVADTTGIEAVFKLVGAAASTAPLLAGRESLRVSLIQSSLTSQVIKCANAATHGSAAELTALRTNLRNLFTKHTLPQTSKIILDALDSGDISQLKRAQSELRSSIGEDLYSEYGPHAKLGFIFQVISLVIIIKKYIDHGFTGSALDITSDFASGASSAVSMADFLRAIAEVKNAQSWAASTGGAFLGRATLILAIATSVVGAAAAFEDGDSVGGTISTGAAVGSLALLMGTSAGVVALVPGINLIGGLVLVGVFLGQAASSSLDETKPRANKLALHLIRIMEANKYYKTTANTSYELEQSVKDMKKIIWYDNDILYYIFMPDDRNRVRQALTSVGLPDDLINELYEREVDYTLRGSGGHGGPRSFDESILRGGNTGAGGAPTY